MSDTTPTATTSLDRDVHGASTTIIPECEIVYEGTDTLKLKRECKKHPGHDKFIPVCDLDIHHLPPEWRTQGHLRFIRAVSNMTVRISVQYTSPDRPDKLRGKDKPYPFSHMKGEYHAARVGTGTICTKPAPVHGLCPCKPCKESDHPKHMFWEIKIKTSTHVVYDGSEAAHAVVECLYDSDSKRGKNLYGIDFCYATANRVAGLESFNLESLNSGITTPREASVDRNDLICVTHDGSLASTIGSFVNKDLTVYPELGTKWGFVISHPHGRSKHISFGHMLKANALLTETDLNFGAADRVTKYDKRSLLCRLPPSSHCATSFAFSYEPNNASPTPQQQQQQQQQQNTLEIGEENGKDYPKPALIEPNQKYTLPNDTTFRFPAGFILGIHPGDGGFECGIRMDKKRVWVTLPSKTILTFPNGNSRCLQQDTEILWRIPGPLYCCYTHNIPTCPGSSGASLVYYIYSIENFFTHFGAVDSDTNVSGLAWVPEVYTPSNSLYTRAFIKRLSEMI